MLTLEQVKKVAALARLELSDADLGTMANQLNAILGYVDQLAAVPTDGVEPMAHPLPLQNVFRDDVPAPSLPVDAALQNAPTRLADFFGVPAVLDFVEGDMQDKFVEQSEFLAFSEELFSRFGAKVNAKLGGEPRSTDDGVYLLLLDPQFVITSDEKQVSVEAIRAFIESSQFRLRNNAIRFTFSDSNSY